MTITLLKMKTMSRTGLNRRKSSVSLDSRHTHKALNKTVVWTPPSSAYPATANTTCHANRTKS